MVGNVLFAAMIRGWASAVVVAALIASVVQAASLDERVAELRGKVQKVGGTIVGVDLENAEVTPADVEAVGMAAELKSLVLWGAAIDDKSLDAIRDLKKLESLTLKNTSVTNAGLKKLAQFPALRQLNLHR